MKKILDWSKKIQSISFSLGKFEKNLFFRLANLKKICFFWLANLK